MFAASKTNAVAGGPDAQFNYVTMLLHGDGTNGAQNNTFVDSSTNNFTITRNGNTTQGSFSPYGSNWSNNFVSSATTYLVTPSSSNLALGTGDFTVETWVNFSNLTVGGNGIFQFSTSTSLPSNLNSLAVGASTTSSAGWQIYANNSQNNATATVVTGTWYHVAIVRSSGVTKLYINGTSVITQTDTKDYTQTYLIIGGFYSNTYLMDGYISNFRVVKGTAVYTSNFTPSTTPLTAITNTQLLTCQSNRFIDNSANAFTVTPTGTPSVQRFNPFGASTAYSTSVIGGSGFFNGNGGTYLTAPSTSGQLGSGDFTIECWSYPISRISLYPCIWSNYSVFTTGSISIFAGHNSASTNKYQVAISGTFPAIESTDLIIYNQWTHLALVRSGSTITLYINGVANGTFTSSATMNGTSGTSFIGTTGDNLAGAYLNGYLSNLRVVSGTAVYTSAFTPPTAPVTAITNTTVLLNMTNGAIFDNAMMNDLQTVGALISTSVKKYGTGSIAFDGSNDYLVSNPATTDLYAFGSGNFTIECWVYINNTTGTQIIYDCRPSGGFGNVPTLYLSSGVLNYYADGTDRITGASLSISTWYHVALVRSSGSTKLYLNGTQTGSTYTDANIYVNNVGRPIIGGNANSVGNNSLNGYIDDLRVTKGFARYTTTFTPPTSALSDTGPI